MMSHSDSLLFSLVLPAYNVENYIERCLESCVNQTYKNYEIIIVDDCGSDDSIRKVERWAKRDSRIRIIRNARNLGTYHARRRGVEAARGKYIIFIDPDDAIKHNALDTIRNYIIETPVDIFLYGVEEFPSGKKGGLDRFIHAKNNDDILKAIFLCPEERSYGTAGKVFNRSVLDKAYKLAMVSENDRLVYGEDALIFYVVSLFSNVMIEIPNKLYFYYREMDSITKRKGCSDVLNNSRQIYLVVSYLYSVVAREVDNKNLAELAGKRVIGKLLSDAALMKRFCNFGHLKNSYVSAVLESFRCRGGIKDIIRLVVYVFSIGFIKL